MVPQLKQHDQADADNGEQCHHRNNRIALLLAAHNLAEGAGQRETDDQHQEDLNEVRPCRRILERVRGVWVVEAAPVAADQLDGFLAGDRPSGDGLRRAGQGGHDLVVEVEVLDHAAGHQDDRADD